MGTNLTRKDGPVTTIQAPDIATLRIATIRLIADLVELRPAPDEISMSAHLFSLGPCYRLDIRFTNFDDLLVWAGAEREAGHHFTDIKSHLTGDRLVRSYSSQIVYLEPRWHGWHQVYLRCTEAVQCGCGE